MRTDIHVPRQMSGLSRTKRRSIAAAAAGVLPLLPWMRKYIRAAAPNLITASNSLLLMPNVLPSRFDDTIKRSNQCCGDANHTTSTNTSMIAKCLDLNHAPRPFILMSFGRSGTESTCQIIGSLMGRETPCNEYTGSNERQSRAFFDKVGAHDGGMWLTKYLCGMQRKFPDAGAVGFKWKPHRLNVTPGAMNGLRVLSDLKVPMVVRNRRNLLDVWISVMKHKKKRVSSHCGIDDEECVKAHLNATKSVELPTRGLLDLLRNLNRGENEVDEVLEAVGVPHVHVAFEKLYYGADASEWMKIFHFFGDGPMEGLTMDKVNGAMQLAQTSPGSQRKTIRNFDEVQHLLSGSEFEELLRP